MNSVFFIAEAGKNFINVEWRGSSETRPVGYYLENALRLAKAAKEAGADAIKFQTHVFEDEQHMRDVSRHEWIKFNESITPISFWVDLKEACDRYGIEFMTTPMSRLAAEKVNDLVQRWKVGSGNVTDYELLKYLATTKKPVVLSTGMSTEKQVEKAVDILKGNKVSLMYCKSIYPCPIGKVNFEMLKWLRHYGHIFKNVERIGFSDHTVEITTPLKAFLNGAKVIEKHFTLDKYAIGPDHFFSLAPHELKLAIQLVQEYEDYPQSSFYPEEEEIKLWKTYRKS